MASFLQEALRLSKQAFCDVTAAADTAYEIFRGLTDSSLPNFSVPGALNQLVCDRPALPPQPPFQGGQCDGVLYTVTLKITSTTQIGGDTSTRFTATRFAAANVTGKVTGSSRSGAPPAQALDFFVNSSTGDVFVTTEQVGGGVSIVENSFGISSIERVDGLPDECGNPPRNVPPYPPGGNQRDYDFTFDAPGGISVTIPVGIAVGYVQVNAQAQVQIPLTFNFNLNPEFNFTWNWNPFSNTGEPQDDKPKDPNKPGCDDPDPGADPDNPPDPDPDEPPAPPDPPQTEPDREEQILRAAIVTVSASPDSVGTLFQGRAPDIAIPNYGYINFQVKVGRDFFWLPDQPVKNKRTLIPCEWEFGATDVVGEPRPGVTWRITKVYIKRTIKAQFPPDTVV